MKGKFLIIIFLISISIGLSLNEPITPTGKYNQLSPDTIEFNEIMDLWNSHQYNKAKLKFEKFIEKYPLSVWKAEAKFHLGCLSYYEKEYNKAEEIFKQLKQEYKNTNIENKVNIRLSNLYYKQNRIDESIEKLKEVLSNNPTPSQYKYSFAWLRHLKTQQIAQKRANLCGIRALAYCLKILGKEKEANNLLTIKKSDQPYSISEIIKMAKDYGIEAYGARLDYKKLNMIKKPVIIYIKNKNHFIVLKELNGKKAKIIDPFNGEKEEEIENIRKLWEGEAIIFTKIEKKYLLTEKEMNEYKGGCCGKALPPPCLGNDCETCPAELPSVSPAGSSKGCVTGNCGGFNRGKNGSIGANPKISVNPRSLNLIVEETPIGYNSQIGPSVYIKLTYNTDDSDTGFFGNGWSSILDIRLYEQPDQSIIIKRSSGNQTIYVYSDGNYISPAGIYHTLIKNSDGTFTLKEKSGTKYYFGTNQRIKKIEDRNGNFITFNYDSYDRPIEIIDSVGRKTTITYNSNNLVSQIEDPIGRSAYFSYDEAGNLISITDIGGYSCSFTYDSNNNINSITTPLGTTNIIYQNPYWQMYRIKIITPNGKTTDYFWDGSGFTSGANIITTPAGKQTWYFVNWEGVVDTILEAITPVEIPDQQPSWISIPEGYYTYLTYDENKNLIQKTDPLGNTYTYTYDTNGNLISSTDPYGKTTTYSYDSNNNLTSITDPLGRTTYFTYDEKGNLISKQDPLGNTYTYTYNSNGKITSMTDPKGNSTNFEYDSYGNLTKIIDPLGNQTTFTYDIIGRKISQTDAKGRTTNYTYDNMDRITQIKFPDNSTISYTYNCCGISTITDQNGKTTYYTYDNMMNLIKIRDANGNETIYTYDEDCRLNSINDPKGNITTFTYDYLGNLIKKTYPDGSYETYHYDGNKNLIKKIKPDGKTINYKYDKLNRLIEVKVE